MSCDSGAGAESSDGEATTDEVAEATVQLTLKQQMNLAIQRSMSAEGQPTVSPNIVKSTTAAIRTEFTIFQNGRSRKMPPVGLELPASVKAELAYCVLRLAHGCRTNH